MSKKKKDWKTEKERREKLTLEERRKEYRRSDVVQLNDISAWSRGSESKEQKSVLSKISLYKGDITVLEVDAIVNAGTLLSGLLVYFAAL
ncbi:hypothetical protein UPYG_G00329310 [Umbra pygmaea]|uniref:O-acetyl-ADP-ribose deacetylase MACROD2 n=1 Tax=Umbra pygmaea TaxID=75934 RepID=A0ABD0WKN2_UMBPY